MNMSSLIELFARHRNGANLLFISMIMFGVFGVVKLNTQFFPTIEVNNINVTVVWAGATPQDIDTNIIGVIEPEVRFIDSVKEVRALSREGFGTITLEFVPNADMQRATSDVEAAINAIETLPQDAEKPIIAQEAFHEEVASILVSGALEERALRRYAKNIRDGLLSAGVDKITLEGLRDEEIWVEVKPAQLRRYNLEIGDIGARIRNSSLDTPGGVLRGGIEKQVRAVGLAKSAADVAAIDLRNAADGRALQIGDVAHVSERFDAAQAEGFKGEHRAVRLTVQRTKTTDALATTKIIRDYLRDVRPTLPPSVKVELFDVQADKIVQRINVLVVNGFGGMVLVLITLFLFLNGRIALWVAAGIPASIMATFGAMWMLGLSINMLTMFALIMTVGIIVDDAVVVGEHASTLSEGGATPLAAAEGSARLMAVPIMASALTTLAAFLPMLVVEGTFGQIVRAIPIVVFCVLIASLIECFLVLPGHLSHSLVHVKPLRAGWRKRFLDGFETFRATRFRRFVTRAYENRYTTLAVGLGVLILCIGILSSGRLPFRFFPSPEGEVVRAYAFFQPGTARAETLAGLRRIENALDAVEIELGGAPDTLIKTRFTQVGRTESSSGDERGYIWAELVASENRAIRTEAIVKLWEDSMPDMAGVRYVFVREERAGPPGRDIDIRLHGDDLARLKLAALDVRAALERFNGVSRASDNLFYNKQQLLLKVNAQGAALGFNNQSIGAATRGNLQGQIAKRFARDDEEVSVRVLQPRDKFAPRDLAAIELRVPNTAPPRYVSLAAIVDVVEEPGFSSVRRVNGNVSVSVVADYEASAGNPNNVLAALARDALPQITQAHNIGYYFGGRSEEQRETLSDLLLGAAIALGLIYVILAFVFADYVRPLVIMAIIPFGLVGTTLGHYIQGFDLTFLSLIGLLGLSGILVNNSIILISRIDARLGEGEDLRTAIIGGVCDRMRPVMLTSLTTVLGLTPLLFETSVQAQFLLPMVITLAWGLGCASLIVLFLVPALLGVMEDTKQLLNKAFAKAPKNLGGA